MRIFLLLKFEGITWIDEIVDKLANKHHVDIDEVEEVLHSAPQIRFLEKGNRRNEDVYVALGRTDAGRYLSVMFIYKTSNQRNSYSQCPGYGAEREKSLCQDEKTITGKYTNH